ncbi:unnamed protein product [Leptidea sinapis]|uniref:Neurotransmitter-gated ion-channel ligand-binding domain-containing protein n=1 Tax=Leptidea sinapis TaxID=189913 RepID=A0A5E4Q9R6_9NEOP|nr:unnamed protein product [Leptidea sinapis]
MARTVDMGRILTFLSFFILVMLHESTPALGECSLSTQLDTLLAEYDREVMPATPLRIEATLDVRHANVYEKSSTVHLLADLHMRWNDSRISWNATEWGCEGGMTASERLWLPDVVIVSVASIAGGDQGFRAHVSSDGEVSWVQKLDVSIPVSLELQAWPEDTQEAHLKVASRSHANIDEIDLDLIELKCTIVLAGAGVRVAREPRSLEVAVRPTARRPLAAPAPPAARRCCAGRCDVARVWVRSTTAAVDRDWSLGDPDMEMTDLKTNDVKPVGVSDTLRLFHVNPITICEHLQYTFPTFTNATHRFRAGEILFETPLLSLVSHGTSIYSTARVRSDLLVLERLGAREGLVEHVHMVHQHVEQQAA